MKRETLLLSITITNIVAYIEIESLSKNVLSKKIICTKSYGLEKGNNVYNYFPEKKLETFFKVIFT